MSQADREPKSQAFRIALEVCSQVLHGLRAAELHASADLLAGHVYEVSDSARSALDAASTGPAHEAVWLLAAKDLLRCASRAMSDAQKAPSGPLCQLDLWPRISEAFGTGVLQAFI
jgi:hypothetical protein